jgi:hypothetical protein
MVSTCWCLRGLRVNCGVTATGPRLWTCPSRIYALYLGVARTSAWKRVFSCSWTIAMKIWMYVRYSSESKATFLFQRSDLTSYLFQSPTFETWESTIDLGQVTIFRNQANFSKWKRRKRKDLDDPHWVGLGDSVIIRYESRLTMAQMDQNGERDTWGSPNHANRHTFNCIW